MKKICIITLLFFNGLICTDGSLDPSFGTAGKIVVNLGGTDVGYATVMQPDKKILLAGTDNNDFVLARYDINGTVDNSFGTLGIVKTDIGGGTQDIAHAVVLQEDGRIIAVGTSANNFALVRYAAGGSLDPSFGTGGKVTTDFGGTDVANSAVLQPDGKIVAVGTNGADFAVARYRTDGVLDTSFGPSNDGLVLTDVSSGGGNDSAYSVLLQEDGKIIAVGTANVGNFALVRYKTNGSLDTSFGTNGIVTTNFTALDIAYGALLQADDKIVAVGSDGDNFELARYNTDGSLDTSFGIGGKVITNLGGSDEARAVVLQPDGKIVAIGFSGTDFALVRYKIDGSLDTTFGTNGIVTTNFGGTDVGRAGVVLADGNILVVGNAGGDAALAVYEINSIKVSSLAQDIRAKYTLLQQLRR